MSDDYQPDNDQWRIGLTSIFAWALNLAPFKDTFWSSGTQPGNRYGLGTLDLLQSENQVCVPINK